MNHPTTPNYRYEVTVTTKYGMIASFKYETEAAAEQMISFLYEGVFLPEGVYIEIIDHYSPQKNNHHKQGVTGQRRDPNQSNKTHMERMITHK